MEFYAIAFKYQEDVWFDLEKGDNSSELKASCLLPTYDLAEEYISDELSMQYHPVKIKLEILNKNGVWSWSRDAFPDWD